MASTWGTAGCVASTWGTAGCVASTWGTGGLCGVDLGHGGLCGVDLGHRGLRDVDLGHGGLRGVDLLGEALGHHLCRCLADVRKSIAQIRGVAENRTLVVGIQGAGPGDDRVLGVPRGDGALDLVAELLETAVVAVESDGLVDLLQGEGELTVPQQLAGLVRESSGERCGLPRLEIGAELVEARGVRGQLASMAEQTLGLDELAGVHHLPGLGDPLRRFLGDRHRIDALFSGEQSGRVADLATRLGELGASLLEVAREEQLVDPLRCRLGSRRVLDRGFEVAALRLELHQPLLQGSQRQRIAVLHDGR